MKNRYKQKLIFVIAILCLSLVSCKSKTEPINNIASWTPDDGWTINGIDIRDDYANFILLYQDQEIADVEISKFAESYFPNKTPAIALYVFVPHTSAALKLCITEIGPSIHPTRPPAHQPPDTFFLSDSTSAPLSV